MTDAEIYESLTKLFREHFADNRITLKPGMTSRDIAGWNSLKMIGIIMAVEQQFDFQMSSGEIDRLRSVADIVAVIKNNRRSKTVRGAAEKRRSRPSRPQRTRGRRRSSARN